MSENDLEITGEQSHTVEETVITHNAYRNPSRKRRMPRKELRFVVNNRLLITWKQESI